MKKKIGYIGLFIFIVAAIVAFFIFSGKIKFNNSNKDNSQVIGSRSSNEKENTTGTETNKVEEKQALSKESIRKELDDGILYTFSEDEIKPDIVIGDNFFDTQITDIMNNFNLYKGKTIEIEGMYLDSNPYTFVGRYSTSNMCAYCPQGYSYFEYVWNGEKFEVVNEQTWLKIKGKLCVGNDETSYFQDYYYIDAESIEVMNEKGIDTVNN